MAYLNYRIVSYDKKKNEVLTHDTYTLKEARVLYKKLLEENGVALIERQYWQGSMLKGATRVQIQGKFPK